MTTISRLVFVVIGVVLSACSDSEQEDLQKWMSEQRASTKPRVESISAPKMYTPKPYTQEALTEPFSNQKLLQALKRDSSQATANVGLVTPELSRRKEALEAFPLDTMAMVGSLQQGQPTALVQVDKLLYQVKVGNYLGLNYGKVTKISESEVALREIVQDAAGEWIERQVSLQLQERSK
jgi:type IV pilus assembly protein PilP